MSFDRRVHHFDKDGNVKKITPFVEIVHMGFPNLIITHENQLIFQDGKPYERPLLTRLFALLNDDLRSRYCPRDILVEIKKSEEEKLRLSTKPVKEPEKDSRPQLVGQFYTKKKPTPMNEDPQDLE